METKEELLIDTPDDEAEMSLEEFQEKMNSVLDEMMPDDMTEEEKQEFLDELAKMKSVGEEADSGILGLFGIGASALLEVEAGRHPSEEPSEEELQAKAAEIVTEIMDEEDKQAALAALVRIKLKGKSVEEVKIALAFEMLSIEKIQEIMLTMTTEDKQEILDVLSDETRNKVLTNIPTE